MQVDLADLRSMMWQDIVGLVLGGLILVTGVLILALVAFLRRRGRGLLWVGVFALLYGSRLLIRTGIVRLMFDVPTSAWEYIESAITYSVPIPIVVFARGLMPTWRRFWTVGAIGLTGFAACAIASDLLLARPDSATTANNLIAIAFFAGLLGWIFRPGLKPSREVWTVRVGALSVSLAAMVDNLQGIGVLRFSGPDLEPFGFTVFIACLAVVAVRRVLGDAQRLVAIDRELNIARQIQSSILPQTMPQVPGLTIAARYRPMTAVAGDFYDFLEVDAHRLGVLVADVAGHGVPAALIASMIKVALAAQREHADSPAAVLGGMNQTLCGQLAGQYVTAAYLFLDLRSRTIRYAAAGHPPMLRSSGGHGSIDEVVNNGLLLGFIADAPYEQSEYRLQGDDRFLLYTDGLIEAANAADDLYGLERLKASLVQAAGLQPHAATDRLLSTLDIWSGIPPADDLTLVLIDCTSAG
jgi:phosphoserine phosphatase RsbU/P